MTLARPAAASTTTAMTRSCSSWVSVGASPVVPTGLRIGVPWAMCHSTRRRRAGSSIAPSWNGVTRATVHPANIRPFLGMPFPEKSLAVDQAAGRENAATLNPDADGSLPRVTMAHERHNDRSTMG